MAKKSNLKFNPETLEYEEDKKSSKKKYISALTILMAGFVIYGILFVASSYVAETPAERRIKRENKILEEQYVKLMERKKQTEAMLSELTEKDKKIYRAIFETEPELDTMLSYNPYDRFSTSPIESFAGVNEDKLVHFLGEVDSQELNLEAIKKLISDNKEELKYIPAIKPVGSKTKDYIIYGYGNRIDPMYKSSTFHPGLDFAAPTGTRVYATADGKITHAGEKRNRKGNQRGMGKQIRIKHGKSYETVYAHLNSIKVRNGQKVKRGDYIGTVGNTGKSFVPHLHYEVILNGEQINPINFLFIDLTPEEYQELYSASLRGGLSLD